METVPQNADSYSESDLVSDRTVVWVSLQQIRLDGETQARSVLNAVQEYTELMREGVHFPPVRLWFDGTHYWLSDGFQRIAAARSLGHSQIQAEIRLGSLEDAQWDSYSANSTHEVRRSRADVERIIQRALIHPRGIGISTNQLAKELNISESTVRRARKRLLSATTDDVRTAKRGGHTYRIRVARIGRTSSTSRVCFKSKTELRSDLVEMRTMASSDARRLLAIFEKWLLAGATAKDCLIAAETIIREWKRMPPS